MGADVLEVDVRATGDGSLVLHHDRRLDGERLDRLTLDTAKRLARKNGFELATLSEAMRELAGIRWNLEFKEKNLAEPALEIARAHAPATDVLVSSFRPRLLTRTDELAPEVLTGLLLGPVRAMRLLYRRGRARRLRSRAEKARADAIIPHKSFLRLGLLSTLRAVDRPLIVWTMNHPRRLERVVRLPFITGVITDRTARAVHLRRWSTGTIETGPTSVPEFVPA